jgi:hypothetical protein
MKRTLVLLAFGFAAVAIAAGKTFTLVLNGQISKDKAITVSGKTYVPLSAIQALGVKVSTGGSAVSLTMPVAAPAPVLVKPVTSSTPVAVTQPSTSPVTGTTTSSGAGGVDQRPSVEGCMGENLFNGVWRFRVASVTKTDVAYNVVVEFVNGVNKTITLEDTGVSENHNVGFNLVLEDQQTLVPEYVTPFGAWGTAVRKAVPQGALNRYTFVFEFGPETAKPAKFLVEVDPNKVNQKVGFKYTVASPSFRVDLTCTK